MTTTQKLVSALAKITGTGKFTSCGDSSFFLPNIRVHDEELAFPLPPSQIKHLISLAEQAAYGKGHDTVLDESVRKSWQIDAQHITFPKKGNWTKYLKKINASIAEDMGIHQPFILDPYKLLIYEKGGHFLPHTDTEKIAHMFGTLVVALPSKHHGGELIVRHAGEEVSVPFDSSSTTNFQHAAFFSDCEHEVKPVTSGYRVCITYNIAFKKKPTMKLNEGFTTSVPKLTDILTQLHPEIANSKIPLRAILLNHQYTEEHFSFAALKNEDFTKAKALMTAAEIAGYQAHLGLITLYQMGELDGYYEDDYGHDIDYDSGSMGEIYDEELNLDHWRDKDDKPVRLGNYKISPDIYIPKTDLTASQPDEEESEGYTGNAGCTMEYWYRKAAIVIWPKESLNAVLCKYNFNSAAKKFLNYKKNGLNKKSAEDLGRTLLNELGNSQDTKGFYKLSISETMAGICKIRSMAMLANSLQILSPYALAKVDQATWKQLFKTFDHDQFIPYFENFSKEMISIDSQIFIPPLQALLSQSKDSPLLGILANHIKHHSFIQKYTYSRENISTVIDVEILNLMIAASGFITGQEHRKNLRKLILHDLSLNYIREKLAPALLKLSSHFSHRNSFHASILKRIITILEKETANPVTPYTDWTRPYNEPTHSRLAVDSSFSKLKFFCLDPELQSADFKVRAEIRDSIEGHIESCQLDFNCKTIKQGTPYILRLTKNSNSYRRAFKIQKLDMLLLKKLRLELT